MFGEVIVVWMVGDVWVGGPRSPQMDLSLW
jgi:hypothetical protein